MFPTLNTVSQSVSQSAVFLIILGNLMKPHLSMYTTAIAEKCNVILNAGGGGGVGTASRYIYDVWESDSSSSNRLNSPGSIHMVRSGQTGTFRAMSDPLSKRSLSTSASGIANKYPMFSWEGVDDKAPIDTCTDWRKCRLDVGRG